MWDGQIELNEINKSSKENKFAGPSDQHGGKVFVTNSLISWVLASYLFQEDEITE